MDNIFHQSKWKIFIKTNFPQFFSPAEKISARVSFFELDQNKALACEVLRMLKNVD